MKRLVGVLILLFLCLPVFGQTAYLMRMDRAEYSASGVLHTLPNAAIKVCQYNVLRQCTNTVQIYSDPYGVNPLTNPFSADSNGNYQYFVPSSAAYLEQVSSPGVSAQTYYITAGASVLLSSSDLTDAATIAHLNAGQAWSQPQNFGAGITTSSISGTFTIPWSKLTGTPTTVSGYGITDGATSAQLATKQSLDGACGPDGSGNLTCVSVTASSGVHTKDIVSESILTAFGDSNTVGYGLANPTTDGYIYKLTAAKDWTLYNKAVSGSMCADQAAYFMIESPIAGSNFLLNLGYNDFRVNGGADASKAAQFQGCMMAAVAKLGLLNSQYIPASQAQTVSGQPGCTYTGTWTTPTLYGQTEAYTTANGATITCVTPPGSTVYLFGLSQVGNAAQSMTVTIDGNAVGCNSQTNTCASASALTELGTVTTPLGATYAPQVWRWAGLSDNYHTVVVTVVGAGAGGTHLLGFAAAGSSVDGTAMPQVMAVQVPRMNAAGYASGSGWPGGGGDDAAVATYNERIRQVVSDAVQDGLQVRTVDLSSTAVLDPYDVTQMQSDNVHFSAKGHAQIAAAIGNAYSGVNLARDRGASQMLRNVSPFNGGLYAGGPPLNSARGQIGTATGEVTGDVTFGHDGCAIRRTASKTWQLAGNCSTGIDFLQFAGATAAYPAFKVAGGTPPIIIARKADDSGDADFQANSFKNTAGNLTPFIIASGTATLTSAAIATTACGSTVTVGATGVSTTDVIQWTFASAPGAADSILLVNAWPTSGNVNFKICNPTAGTYTPSGLVVNWKVSR